MVAPNKKLDYDYARIKPLISQEAKAKNKEVSHLEQYIKENNIKFPKDKPQLNKINTTRFSSAEDIKNGNSGKNSERIGRKNKNMETEKTKHKDMVKHASSSMILQDRCSLKESKAISPDCPFEESKATSQELAANEEKVVIEVVKEPVVERKNEIQVHDTLNVDFNEHKAKKKKEEVSSCQCLLL